MKEFNVKCDDYYVHYTADIIYDHKDDMDLKLQLLQPSNRKNTERNFPVIVFIQGSAWYKQDVYGGIPTLSRMAAKGYAVASVEYRPSTTAMFPAQILDVKTAIKFLRLHSAEYHIDMSKLVLWGDSSGGHTALMAGLTDGIEGLDGDTYGNEPVQAKGIAAYYPPTAIYIDEDFPANGDRAKEERPEGTLMGKVNLTEHPELAYRAVPMNYISRDRQIPPVLIVHGDSDGMVDIHQSVLLEEKLKEEGKRYDAYSIPGADHASLEFWSEDTLELVADFVSKCVHSDEKTTVERVEIDGLDELAGLASKIWHEYFPCILTAGQIDYMVGKFQSKGAMEEQIRQQRYEYYFICRGSERMGYIGMRPGEDGRMFLSKLYLRKEARGLGIASAALDFITKRCSELGLHSVWLTVNKYNEHTIAVYRHFGFETIRTQVTDIGEGYVMDDYVMQKTVR